MILQKIRKFLYLIKIFLFFSLNYKSYLDLIKLLKFVFYQKKKIQYYKVRERYGQLISGIFMALSTFQNDPIILYLKKNILHSGFDDEFIRIFNRKNCIIIQSEFLYQAVRYILKSPKAENFISNYHQNESLKNKKMFNFNIIKHFNFRDNYTLNDYLYLKYLKKNKIKKIIIIALKEKNYYQKNKIFKNYIQPDYEFDDINRLQNVVNYFCKKKYLVIRIGKNLRKTKIKNKFFFDYASSKEFNNFSNDLYLGSIADCLVGNQTGFDSILNLWFKKKVYYFQIRSYKFLPHFPNIYFSKMSIKRNKKKLEIYQQLELESSLWKSQDQNDLYKEYVKNKMYVSKYSSSIIIKNINFFLNNNSKKFNNKDFYKNYLKYFSKEYKKIGKYLPVYFANYIKN